MKIGNTNVASFRLGNATPSKVYLGTTEVWTAVAPLTAPVITTTNYPSRSFGTVSGEGTVASPLTYSGVNGKYSSFTVTAETLNSATLTKTGGGSSSLIIRGTASFTFNGSPVAYDYDFEDYRVTVTSGAHSLVFPTGTYAVEVFNCSGTGCNVSFTLAFA
jgi:hypothetical protein